MSKLTVTLSDETQKRLETLAVNMDQSVAACAQQAIREFVENWEDHFRVVAALQDDEARPVLTTVAAEHG